mmetsp:Transcript_51026/g.120869  ORF Transcript_51026/g.120869 Transcript_51026/m.120869 type:complete len:319 (-) Transcript_51026:1165-2121(-)
MLVGASLLADGVHRSQSLGEQELLEERDHRQLVLVCVGFLGEAMPLVAGHHVPHLRPVFAHLISNLLCLGQGHSRIVRALDDEKRSLDLVGVGEGRYAEEPLAHRRVALVSVFHPPELTPVAGSVGEKRNEVGDPHHVDAAADSVAEVDQTRQHHVPPIAPAPHCNPLRVEPWLRCDPIEQRADVFDRVLALFGVVERHKHLAIPVGATHVRINHRHAELRGQKLDDRREVWAVLAFRTAVRVDDHRDLALFARPVDERADLAVVERLVADQIGRDEVRPVEPPDLRLRPPRELLRDAVFELQRVRVHRCVGADVPKP